MTRLLLRSLAHYWRTNAAVVGGVATAVAVLAGALLVGQSVRASLRDLLVERIGATAYAVSADRYFRDDLLAGWKDAGGETRATTTLGPDTCPIIAVPGILVRESSGRRAYGVNVYGVDERFWRFHGLPAPEGFGDRSAFVGAPLAAHLEARPGDGLLLRIESDRDIPGESLYGRRESAGRTIRLTCSGVASPKQLGEFALRPGQGAVFSVFVPLKRLQRDLAQPSRVNAMLFTGGLQGDLLPQLRQALRERASLSDVGLRLRTVADGRTTSVESARVLLDDSIARSAFAAADEAGAPASGVLAYLANVILAGGREIPYSVVAAADLGRGTLTDVRLVAGSAMNPDAPGAHESIWLNEWAWRDVGVPIGAPIEIEYYHWESASGLVTKRATLRLAGVVAIGGAVDATLAPDVPGITGAKSVRTWDPPFPLDLRRIRPADEAVLGSVSRDAEGVRHARRRAVPVAKPIRAADVGAGGAHGADAGRVAPAPDRPRDGGVHRRGGPSRRPRLVARRGRPGRLLPLLQLLPDRCRRAAVGVVLPTGPRAARAGGRHAASHRLLLAHAAAPVPLGRRRAVDGGQPAGRCRRPRLRRRTRRRPPLVVGRRGRHRPGPPPRLLGRHRHRHDCRHRGIARRRCLDTAQPGPQLAAGLARGCAGVASGHHAEGSRAGHGVRSRVRCLHPRAGGVGRRLDSGRRRILRCRHAAARIEPEPGGRDPAPAAPAPDCRSRLAGRRPPRIPRRRAPAGPESAAGRAHRLGRLHHRLGRSVPEGPRRRRAPSALGNGRIRPGRHVGTSHRLRPRHAGRARGARHDGVRST